MIPVGSHGLGCIGEEEYAALALYMQCTAEAVDATLTEQSASLDLLINRPVAIMNPLAPQIFSSSDTLFNTMTFTNAPFFSVQTGFNSADGDFSNSTVLAIGSAVGATVEVPYLPGLYEIGVFCDGVSTVPAAGTGGRVMLVPYGPDGFPVAPYNRGINSNPVFEDYEATTGGTIRFNGTLVVNLTGTSGVVVAADIFKIGATATWTTSSTLWARYLGPTDNIEVT